MSQPGTEGEESRPKSLSVELVGHCRTGPAPFDIPADFIIRTPQETNWHVSAAILSFTSSFFRDLPREPPNPDGPFVLAVSESDAVLEAILRFSYPGPDPILHDLDDVTEAYAAAQKYQLNAATQALQLMLLAPRFVEAEPVRVYAIARRLGVDDVADAAALYACKTPPSHWPFCDEFAHITAAQYHDLLVYHRRRGAMGQELGEPCRRCGKQWAKKYRTKAARALVDAPASVWVFEIEFVAKFARDLECKECSHSMLQALRPDGTLSKLKVVVERLPLSVIQGASCCCDRLACRCSMTKRGRRTRLPCCYLPPSLVFNGTFGCAFSCERHADTSGRLSCLSVVYHPIISV
ncbi:uncharacterized protein PHACADRAFT_253291 [Phanerochaete carnosa HHB-10118-sp]|uniref:BTB domain-containing protein n=1 Tax=Phanerochaete carnosa (strain HHB-10118-sp) TaxID=650164 RepID=K5WAM5_PHACS|nr:uncharacterized protein PHACADRAFT_253291 [Phanerochaete carnosa HHB-10118-sp]EKM56260.1 hypothetical protein PHACADRAFT_253291 [Phanerochaete carnosa HHB-10118-sp]